MKYEGEVKGKIKEAKGTVKENLGKSFGNREMQDRGTREGFAGWGGPASPRHGRCRRRSLCGCYTAAGHT